MVREKIKTPKWTIRPFGHFYLFFLNLDIYRTITLFEGIKTPSSLCNADNKLKQIKALYIGMLDS
ncbi:hypothetical protein ABID42_004016 [Arcicella rosea]